MQVSPEVKPDLPRPHGLQFPRLLAAASTCLFGAFLIGSVAAILPLRLLDPYWQTSFIELLINNSSMALVAMVMLSWAKNLAPEIQAINLRYRKFEKWSFFVSISFLLLIPLQLYSSAQQIRFESIKEANSVGRAVKQIDSIRNALKSATSPEDLKFKLETFPGLELPQDLLTQPLNQTRSRMVKDLRRQEVILRAQLGSPTRAAMLKAIVVIPKTLVSSLLFSFFFAVVNNHQIARSLILPGKHGSSKILGLFENKIAMKSPYRTRSWTKNLGNFFEWIGVRKKPARTGSRTNYLFIQNAILKSLRRKFSRYKRQQAMRKRAAIVMKSRQKINTLGQEQRLKQKRAASRRASEIRRKIRQTEKRDH